MAVRGGGCLCSYAIFCCFRSGSSLAAPCHSFGSDLANWLRLPPAVNRNTSYFFPGAALCLQRSERIRGRFVRYGHLEDQAANYGGGSFSFVLASQRAAQHTANSRRGARSSHPVLLALLSSWCCCSFRFPIPEIAQSPIQRRQSEWNDLAVPGPGDCRSSFVRAGLFAAVVWRETFRGTGDAWAYMVVLGTGACLAAVVAERIWYPLAQWTLVLADLMLRPFLPGMSVDPGARILGTPSFSLEVAPACSGYEGIGLILVFTTACLWFFRREWRFPRALLLIPIGVAAIWLSNAVRVAGLVFIGSTLSPDVAMQGFHSHFGWIMFNAVALGTCLVARRVSWLTAEVPGRTARPEPQTHDQNAVAAYLMPFVAILATGLLAGLASAGFEWLYPVRIIAAGAALWYFRSTYRQLDWRVGWPALAAGAVVFALWIGLERWLGLASSGVPAPLAQATPFVRTTWIALRILGAIVTVPIAEELAFRGFLLRRLASADFEAVPWRAFQWLPFLISSIVFGVLHGERWLAGMIYALVLMRRGRIGEAVLAHATTNALLAAWVLSTGQWQLW